MSLPQLVRGARSNRFNGATAKEPWKFGKVKPWFQPRKLLQWGHGKGAVEMTVRSNKLVGFVWLQWGHGKGAVEILRI